MGERPSVRELIVVPSIITLAVTLLRLVGELQNWSPALFSREAGGRLALVGIAWLVPIFGIYFALKLARAGERPASPWGVAGYAVVAIILLVAAGYVGGGLLRLPQIAMLILFGVLSWVAILIVRRAWPALSSVLVQYGLAARIPVVIVMLIAMLANWGTHYDVPPPNAPEIAQWPVAAQVARDRRHPAAHPVDGVHGGARGAVRRRCRGPEGASPDGLRPRARRATPRWFAR